MKSLINHVVVSVAYFIPIIMLWDVSELDNEGKSMIFCGYIITQFGTFIFNYLNDL